MDPIHKAALRAADAAVQQIAKRRLQEVPPPLDERPWSQVRRLAHQIQRAGQRGWHGDVGQPKVQAAAAAVRAIDPAVSVETILNRYRPHVRIGEAVFCCVDSIAARAAIWRSAVSRCRFWADGRMLGEIIRVLAVDEEHGRDHYPKTLFAQREAQPGRCTARSTIYAASIAAALMVHQFTRWLRRLPVDQDIVLNLLASEWTVA